MLRKLTSETLNNISKDASLSRVLEDTNRFMPKVRKYRPDGATLSSIYASKREDSWGKIIKQQLLEEQLQNIDKKIAKDEADQLYGRYTAY